MTAGELLIVRHGETKWSASGQHTSRTDVPLTATGEAQARALTPLLCARPIVATLVSPRLRARRTADLAGFRESAQVEPDLVEWSYGEYEGLTTQQIRVHDPGWSIWTGRTPGGESIEDVKARADKVLAVILSKQQHGDVLVIGHGHFGRVLAARYLGQAATVGALLWLDPATLCTLGTEHGDPVVSGWNIRVFLPADSRN